MPANTVNDLRITDFRTENGGKEKRYWVENSQQKILSAHAYLFICFMQNQLHIRRFVEYMRYLEKGGEKVRKNNLWGLRTSKIRFLGYPIR